MSSRLNCNCREALFVSDDLTCFGIHQPVRIGAAQYAGCHALSEQIAMMIANFTGRGEELRRTPHPHSAGKMKALQIELRAGMDANIIDCL